MNGRNLCRRTREVRIALAGLMIGIAFHLLAVSCQAAILATASVRSGHIGLGDTFLRTVTGEDHATATYSGPSGGATRVDGFTDVEARAELTVNGVLNLSLYGTAIEEAADTRPPHGFNATAVWADELTVDDAGLEAIYFVYSVHVAFDDTDSKVFALSHGANATAQNRPVYDFAWLFGYDAGTPDEVIGWEDYTLTAHSFTGVARQRVEVHDGLAQLAISFWASSNGVGFIDGRNTATLLAVTDMNGNTVDGSFSSGMVAQNQISAPVPEPSTLAMFGLGSLGLVVLSARGRRIDGQFHGIPPFPSA